MGSLSVDLVVRNGCWGGKREDGFAVWLRIGGRWCCLGKAGSLAR